MKKNIQKKATLQVDDLKLKSFVTAIRDLKKLYTAAGPRTVQPTASCNPPTIPIS